MAAPSEVEEISTKKIPLDFGIQGEQPCPPEDSGGVGGYSYLLDVIKDPTHPEYDDVRYWMRDGFDPNHFPIKAIRKELREFNKWHQQHPRAKSSPWHQI